MFDSNKADKAVRFVKALKHTKGEWAGKPFQLQPWQEGILRELFGTVNADGFRQYRTGYMEIPRKNGKSELAAAIALYMLFADGEQGAEIYSCASEKGQASLVFNAAASMVRSCPALARRCEIIDSRKTIEIKETNSFYKAISADAGSKHGFNAHCVIYDELHTAPNRDLWDTMATSMGARRQPLMLAITTAGYDRNSICWELHEQARRVIAGKSQDESFFGKIYGAELDDDWTSPEVWKKANPNLNVSCKESFLASECRKAQETPAYENSFRRLYLNQWTSQESRWLPMEKWDKCEIPSFDEEALRYERCVIGLDLSTTTDLTAMTLYFPDLALAKTWTWMPNDVVRYKERKDSVPYREWIRQGYIEATEGNVVDYSYIRDKILSVARKFPNLMGLGYDPWNSTQLAIELEQEDGLTVVPIRQGFATLSPASKELERLVVSNQLKYVKNPVLRWASDNAKIKTDENQNIRPIKSNTTGRIDPLMSLIIAIACQQQLIGDIGSGSSVYDDEDRGFFVI